jgi:hypothetical protein
MVIIQKNLYQIVTIGLEIHTNIEDAMKFMENKSNLLIMMWDNKTQRYSNQIETDVLLSSTKFDRLKNEYQSENGVYLITLMNDSDELDSFYAEDIDFL